MLNQNKKKVIFETVKSTKTQSKKPSIKSMIQENKEKVIKTDLVKMRKIIS